MKKLRGFTMIEIMVVMVIVGALATLGGGAYTKSLTRGRDARRIQDMKTIQNGFEVYYAKHGDYAPIDTMFGDTAIFPKGAIAASGYIVTNTTEGYCACADTENDTNYANSGVDCVFGAEAKTHYCIENAQ